MSILINQNTKVIVQGITGKEGQSATRAMLEYGTNVVAGVRPGKAGEKVEGVPVFDTVKEALTAAAGRDAPPGRLSDVKNAIAGDGPSRDAIAGGRPTRDAPAGHQHEGVVAAIYVPPFAAKAAMLEAIEAGIPLINIIAERVPIQDTAYCLAAAKEKGIRIIGPSSLGFINPGVGRVGVVGGPKNQADEVFQPGNIGVISRSGGMTNEVSWQIRKAGLGQSAAAHVGGDLLMGTTYADLLRLFEKDEQTRAVVIFGEHGGSYEFEIIDLINNKEYTKPLAIYIGGKFANLLPEGMNIGHAGAIVGRGQGAEEKARALSEVGVMVAERYEELAELVRPFD
ncbi:MAG: succinate--CoA ligase subunit alpha [Patescibacteria group bacterium]